MSGPSAGNGGNNKAYRKLPLAEEANPSQRCGHTPMEISMSLPVKGGHAEWLYFLFLFSVMLGWFSYKHNRGSRSLFTACSRVERETEIDFQISQQKSLSQLDANRKKQTRTVCDGQSM